MGLTGSFRGLGITEMLQLIRMARKTGALSVELSDNSRHRIFFRTGQVIGVESGRESLVPLLLERGLLGREDLDNAITLQKRSSRAPLERILLDEGTITREQLTHALTAHAEETVGALIQERGGTISFEDGAEPELDLEIALDIQSLLMAAAVRADEAAREQASAYNPTAVYARTAAGEGAFRAKTMQLWLDHWRVFLAIDGVRTLRAVAEKIQMPTEELSQGVFALSGLGYVELSDDGATGRTVLVVDESAAIQKLVQMALAEENLNLVSAHRADSALKALEEHPADVIIMDVDLPDASGYKLCRQLRAEGSLYRGVPIIMLSARGTPQDERLAAHSGAAAFLSKPFAPGALAEAVRKALA